jgi:hypothetical protein
MPAAVWQNSGRKSAVARPKNEAVSSPGLNQSPMVVGGATGSRC